MTTFDVFVKFEVAATNQGHAERLVQPHIDSLRLNGVSVLKQPGLTEFIVKTNDELDAWMKTFYAADADIENFRLHSLWAWQEQERRKLRPQFEQAAEA